MKYISIIAAKLRRHKPNCRRKEKNMGFYQEAEALRGEIEGLRKQLALAAPEVADFKAAFGRAQEELNHMLDALARIGDEETRGKLRKAGLAMMEAYAGRLGA